MKPPIVTFLNTYQGEYIASSLGYESFVSLRRYPLAAAGFSGISSFNTLNWTGDPQLARILQDSFLNSNKVQGVCSTGAVRCLMHSRSFDCDLAVVIII